MKVSQKVSELQIQLVELTLGKSQFTKGHNSIKLLMELQYLTLHNFILYQVSRKYLKRFHSY